MTRYEYSKRTNNCDSFVKCANTQIYNVKAIFSFKAGQFCLLEKVLLSQASPEINFEGMTTKLSHIFPVQQLSTNQFEVQPIDYIIQQLSFVNLEPSVNPVEKPNFPYFKYVIEIMN